MVEKTHKTKIDNNSQYLTKENVNKAIAHIDVMWGQLERSCPTDSDTLIGLPHSYFVPGSQIRGHFMHDEMYYWDTYFICQGLIGTKRERQAFEQADNLIYLLEKFGMVPTGSRYYLTSRSQPPFLSSLLLDLYEVSGSKEWLAPRIEMVKREYQNVWRGKNHPHWREVFHGLSRNYEVDLRHLLAECESGWDYTTRFSGRALDHIPIDLNSLLYKCEMDFAKAAEVLDKPKEAKQWQQRADERRQQVDKYLWDEQSGFYFDYNYQINRPSSIWSLASYYPLFTGMASKEQAQRLVDNLSKFKEPGGLVTTLDYPNMPEHHPAQWIYPNGWAPLHFLVIKGLARYGYETEAKNIAKRWLNTNIKVFLSEGEFWEKYNVVDVGNEPKEGVYPNQVGFGWTNGVFAALVRDYPDLIN